MVLTVTLKQVEIYWFFVNMVPAFSTEYTKIRGCFYAEVNAKKLLFTETFQGILRKSTQVTVSNSLLCDIFSHFYQHVCLYYILIYLNT